MSMKPILVFTGGLCFFFLIIMPMVIDVIDVNPDHPLYPLEMFGESLREEFVGGANWHIDRATERLEEYTQMVEMNKEKEYQTCLSNYLKQIRAATVSKEETAEEATWKIEKDIQTLTGIWLTRPIEGFWKVPREVPLKHVIDASFEVKSSIEGEFQDMEVVRSGAIVRLENEKIGSKLQRLATDENVSMQALFLTQEGEEIKAYFLFGSKTLLKKPITAAIVQGKIHQLPENVLVEFGSIDGFIFAQRIEEIDPILTVPSAINYFVEEYCFRSVRMGTTYLISSSSIYQQENETLGLGYATNHLDAPYITRDEWYLSILDAHNTESTILPAKITGVALPPDPKVQRALQLTFGQRYDWFEKLIEKPFNRPFVWAEKIQVEKGPFVHLRELVPNLDTCKYDRRVLSTKGIALGEIIDVDHGFPWSLVHFDREMIAVIENESMAALIALDRTKVENAGRLIFGRYRFELSIYTHIPRHYSTVAYPLIIDAKPKQAPAVPLSQAESGDYVKASLENYDVTQLSRIQIMEGLTLEEVDLLLPKRKGPMILTKSKRLREGLKLKKISVEGYVLNASILEIPLKYTQKYGSRLIICQDIREI